VLDPELSASERWMIQGRSAPEKAGVADATRQFRVAHEIGHTLFFDNADPPRRLTPYRPDEEIFCDRFARFALLPGAVPTRAAEIAAERHHKRSSLALLASALVDRTEGTAAIAGHFTEDRARICFTAGLPPMPRNASFRWPDTWVPDRPLQKTDLYWPVDHPQVHAVDGWSDGEQFLMILRLGEFTLGRVA